MHSYFPHVYRKGRRTYIVISTDMVVFIIVRAIYMISFASMLLESCVNHVVTKIFLFVRFGNLFSDRTSFFGNVEYFKAEIWRQTQFNNVYFYYNL